VTDGFAGGGGGGERVRAAMCFFISSGRPLMLARGKIGMVGMSGWLISSACNLLYATTPSEPSSCVGVRLAASAANCLAEMKFVGGAASGDGGGDESRKMIARSWPPVRDAKCCIRLTVSSSRVLETDVRESSRRRSWRVDSVLPVFGSTLVFSGRAMS